MCRACDFDSWFRIIFYCVIHDVLPPPPRSCSVALPYLVCGNEVCLQVWPPLDWYYLLCSQEFSLVGEVGHPAREPMVSLLLCV